jgi:hypothetical protein
LPPFSIYRQNIVFADIGKSIPQTFSDSQQQLDKDSKKPILEGFAFLFSRSDHGTTASSLATSFASRVV